MSKLRRLPFVLALLLAPALAPAAVIEFEFQNEGTVFGLDHCGISCTVASVGTATEIGDNVPGTSSWTFAGLMQFFNVGGSGGFGVGATVLGGGWLFADDSGLNSLFGSFSMTLDGNDASTTRTGTVNYLVEGGTGLFYNGFGLGASHITYYLTNDLNLDSFYEAGSMRVAVSEPGTLALVGLGLFALALVVRRRRLAAQR